MRNNKKEDREFRVAIVEDHPDFRAALSASLSAHPQISLLPACKDLPAGRVLLEQTCPDLLLVDLGLPSGSGMGLIRMAQGRYGGRCTSAVLTVTGNEEHLLNAVASGAKGYLFKSDLPEEWLRQIQVMLDGGSPLHGRVAQVMFQRLSHAAVDAPSGRPMVDEAGLALLEHIAAGYTIEEAARHLDTTAGVATRQLRNVYDALFRPLPDLTPRERELLQLLDRGYLLRECARLMGVGEATVKTHAARAYEKLGATNVQMALYEARQAGFLG